MALFLSTYVNRIDRKGRVSVPASFRSNLAADGFHGAVLFPSIAVPAIEGWGMRRMQELSAGLDTFQPFSDEHTTFSLSMFPDTHPLSFDGEGRVVLPRDLIEHAGLADMAAFVGLGPTFQVWEPRAFQDSKKAAREKAKRDRQELRLPREEPRR